MLPTRTARADFEPGGLAVIEPTQDPITLADIVRRVDRTLLYYDDCHVYIDDTEIPRHNWHIVRPKFGHLVTIKTGPHGDTGTVILRTLAIAALAYTGAAIISPLAGGGLVGSIAGAGFFAAGVLALNAVLPEPVNEIDNNNVASQSLSLTASRNRLEPYGTVPMALGTIRVVPPFAAKPFTELVGADQYVTMLYCIGYKNLIATVLKFGTVNFEDLNDLQVQYDVGSAVLDTPGGITLYPGSVDEQTINQKLFSLTQDPTPISHATANDTEWITYDIIAPIGLLRVSNNGKNTDQVVVTVVVEYRTVGGGTWLPVNSHTLAGRSGDSIRIGARFEFPAAGNYEVRMWRTTDDTDPTLITSSVFNDDVYWQVLRSFNSEFPVTDPEAAIIAVRVKATEQLNGTPDNFSCLVSQLIPNYNGQTTTTYTVSTDMHDARFTQVPIGTDTGVLPPNWRYIDNGFNGTTLTVLARGVQDGIPYLDLQLDTVVNTSGQEQNAVIWFHTIDFSNDALFPPMNAGEFFTNSIYFAELQNPNVNAVLFAQEFTPAAVIVSQSATPMDGSTFQRYQVQHTITQNGNKPACALYMTIPVDGQVTGYRVRIGCPMIETNVSPASPPAINPEEIPATVARWDLDQVTRNPAAIARYVLTGNGNTKAVPIGDRLNDDSFVKFHDFCEAQNFSYSQYFDNQGTLFDRLNEVMAAGRGRVIQPDGQWLARWDDVQPTIVAQYTPRNSWGYVGEKVYPNEVHGFRVQFRSELSDYEFDEIIVYRPGFNADGASGLRIGQLIETLQFPGVTDPDAIWKLARYKSNLLDLMETHSFNVDPEHLRVVPLDRIEYLDDVILVGFGAGRITAINGLVYTLDNEIALGPNTNAIQVRNKNGDIELRQIVESSALTDTFTLVQQFGIAVTTGDLVAVGESGRVTLPLLVRDIIPQENHNAKLICVPYSDRTYIDDGTIPPPYDPKVTLPPGLESPVFDLIRSDESVMDRNANGDFIVQIVITFAFTGSRANVQSIGTQYRPVLDGSAVTVPWINVARLPAGEQETKIRDVVEGQAYDIRAAYIYTDGTIGPFSAIQRHTVIGKTSLPIAPDFFTVTTDVDGTRLYNWAYLSPDDPDTGKPIDFAGVVIKYWDVGNDGWPAPDDWDSWTALKFDGIITESPHENNSPPQGTYRFAIKAIDTGGRLSEVPTSSLVDVVLGPGRTSPALFRFDARALAWPVFVDGISRRDNCFVGEFNILYADDSTTWQGDANAPNPGTTWLAVPQWSTYGVSGFAYVTPNQDLGSTQLWDWYVDTAGINLEGATVQVWYSLTTTANPAGEPIGSNLYNPVGGFEQINARNIRWAIVVSGAVGRAALTQFNIQAFTPGAGPG